MKLKLDTPYWVKYNMTSRKYYPDSTGRYTDTPEIQIELVNADEFEDGEYCMYLMGWDCPMYLKEEDIIDFVEVKNPFGSEKK